MADLSIENLRAGDEEIRRQNQEADQKSVFPWYIVSRPVCRPRFYHRSSYLHRKAIRRKQRRFLILPYFRYMSGYLRWKRACHRKRLWLFPSTEV